MSSSHWLRGQRIKSSRHSINHLAKKCDGVICQVLAGQTIQKKIKFVDGFKMTSKTVIFEIKKNSGIFIIFSNSMQHYKIWKRFWI
jgi:hypothetical protein